MGRRAQRRAELGANTPGAERPATYAPSDVDKLTRILERALRAGIDPQRVIVALGIPAPIISVAKQRLGIPGTRSSRDPSPGNAVVGGPRARSRRRSNGGTG